MCKRVIALLMAATLVAGTVMSVSAAGVEEGTTAVPGQEAALGEGGTQTSTEENSTGTDGDLTDEDVIAADDNYFDVGNEESDFDTVDEEGSSDTDGDAASVAGEDGVTAETADPSVAEETVSEPATAEGSVSDTDADEETVSDPVVDEDLFDDAVEDTVSAPDGAGEAVSETAAEEAVSEPVSADDVSETLTEEESLSDTAVSEEGSTETLEGEEAVNASAVSGNIGASKASDVTWRLKGSASSGYTLYIEGSGRMKSFEDSTIPWKSYSDYIVKAVVGEGVTNLGHNAFLNQTQMTTVSLPSTLTYIGAYAFMGCTALTAIPVPTGVTFIGAGAFRECESLTSITLPAGLEKIGDGNLFMGCSSLSTAVIPEGAVNEASDKSYCYSGCVKLTKVTVPEDALLVDLDNCAKLTALSLGSKVETLNLSGCKSLKKYDVPDSVTYLCMLECTGLQEVTLPEGMEHLAQDIFSGCGNLKKVTMGSGVTSIGPRAFYECTGLQTLSLPATVTSIGEKAFAECSNLSTLQFPSSLRNIGDGAFTGCAKFTSITIPEGITELGKEVFSDCSGVKTINLPSTLEKIGDYSFCACSGLENVTIPEKVTTIGDSAFSSCTALEKIVIPKSVNTISDYAFEYCLELVRLDIKGTPTSIGTSAFDTYGESTALKYVFFYGEESKWKKYGIDYLPESTKVYCIPVAVTHFVCNEKMGIQKGVTPEYCIPRFKPNNASCKEFSVQIEDSNIVSYNYKLKSIVGKNVGETNVTFISYDGGFRATIKVQVYAPISDMTIEGIVKKVRYTGRECTQTVTVTDNCYRKGYVLKENVDYKLTYTNNIEPGNKAKVYIKGIGDYAGSKSYNFCIQKWYSTPVFNSIKNEKNGVRLRWKSVGSPKYAILRKNDKGVWKKIAITSGLSYLDKGVSSGKQYCYTLRCLESDAKTVCSSYNKNGKKIRYLSAPIITKNVQYSKGVKVYWNKVAGASRYRVYRRKVSKSNGKTTYSTWTLVGSTTARCICDEGGLRAKKGKTFQYTVYCVDSTNKVKASAYRYDAPTITIK